MKRALLILSCAALSAAMLGNVTTLSPRLRTAPTQLRRLALGNVNTLSPRLRAAPTQLRWLVLRTVRGAVGLPTSLESEDRRLLERDILPWFAAQPLVTRVLFVGCDWYTKHYERAFTGRE